MNTPLSPLHSLAHLLQQPPQRQAAWVACERDPEQLALFVSDELAGLPVDETYPDLAGHLDLCPSCLQEYVELSQLAANAFSS